MSFEQIDKASRENFYKIFEIINRSVIAIKPLTNDQLRDIQSFICGVDPTDPYRTLEDAKIQGRRLLVDFLIQWLAFLEGMEKRISRLNQVSKYGFPSTLICSAATLLTFFVPQVTIPAVAKYSLAAATGADCSVSTASCLFSKKVKVESQHIFVILAECEQSEIEAFKEGLSALGKSRMLKPDEQVACLAIKSKIEEKVRLLSPMDENRSLLAKTQDNQSAYQPMKMN